MTFMATGEARKGKWSMRADVLYLDVGDDTTLDSGEKLSADLKCWVVTPVFGYNLVETEKIRFDILGGARYLNLDAELEEGSLSVDASAHTWDGVVGVSGHVNLTETWYLPYYLDIGAGDSDLTWQAFAGVGYKFSKVNVVLTYRYIKWDFDDGHAISDLSFSGPLIGVVFVF